MTPALAAALLAGAAGLGFTLGGAPAARGAGAAAGIGFGLYFLVGSAAVGALQADGDLLLAQLVGSACGGAAAAPFLWRSQGADRLGLRAPGAKAIAGAAVVAGLSLGAAAGWSGLLGALDHPPAPQAVLEQLGRAAPGARAAGLVWAGLGAPLVEELLFRGALVSALRPAGTAAAAGGSAVLFGLAHAADPVAVPPLILMGVALASLRLRTGSTWACAVAHALHNLAALSVYLGAG